MLQPGSTAITIDARSALTKVQRLLPGPLRLLASGGPTCADGGGDGLHAFAALGLDF
jgi:hypothetical protein